MQFFTALVRLVQFTVFLFRIGSVLNTQSIFGDVSKTTFDGVGIDIWLSWDRYIDFSLQ